MPPAAWWFCQALLWCPVLGHGRQFCFEAPEGHGSHRDADNVLREGLDGWTARADEEFLKVELQEWQSASTVRRIQ